MRKNGTIQPDVYAVYARARQPIPVSGSYDLSSSLESDKLWSWLLDFIFASLLLPPKRAARQSWPLCVCARSATLSSSTCATSVHATTLRRHAARAERDEGATRRRGESPNRTLLSVRLPPPCRRSWASLQSELLPLGTSAHSQVTDARSQTYLSYVFNKPDAESELLRCAHLTSSPDIRHMTRRLSHRTKGGFSLEVTECITCPAS